MIQVTKFRKIKRKGRDRKGKENATLSLAVFKNTSSNFKSPQAQYVTVLKSTTHMDSQYAGTGKLLSILNTSVFLLAPPT